MILDVRRARADRPVWTSRTTREPAALSMLWTVDYSSNASYPPTRQRRLTWTD